MGYRSKVKILAGNNPAKELHEINEKYHIFDSETPGKGGITLFTRDWVKWYEDDDFPEVDAVMKVIDKYEDIQTGNREDGIDYYRLGEDSEDVDHRSNYTLPASLELTIAASGFTPEK